MKITLEMIEWILGGILALSVVVEITPIRINPWGWLLKKIGKEINAEIFDKLRDVEKKLDDHILADEEESIRCCRNRILKFSDEIIANANPTKERFDEILGDIDTYEQYCMEHPKYPNSKAKMSIKTIRDTYVERAKSRSFPTQVG